MKRINSNVLGVKHFLEINCITFAWKECVFAFLGKTMNINKACILTQKDFTNFKKFVNTRFIYYADTRLIIAKEELQIRRDTFKRLRKLFRNDKDGLNKSRMLMNSVYGGDWREFIIRN